MTTAREIYEVWASGSEPHAWGVYQILGKLCPTVYVWERRG